MKAILRTYCLDTKISDEEVELPDNYDGDPYGDTVPFVIGSNQRLDVCDLYEEDYPNVQMDNGRPLHHREVGRWLVN